MAAEHLGCINRERAHHIYRNCLQTEQKPLAFLANPMPLLYGLCNEGVTWQVFLFSNYMHMALATLLGMAPVGGDFGWPEG